MWCLVTVTGTPYRRATQSTPPHTRVLEIAPISREIDENGARAFDELSDSRVMVLQNIIAYYNRVALPQAVVPQHVALNEALFHVSDEAFRVHRLPDVLARREDKSITVACGHQSSVRLLVEVLIPPDAVPTITISPPPLRHVLAYATFVKHEHILVLEITAVPPGRPCCTFLNVALHSAPLQSLEAETEPTTRDRRIDRSAA